MGLIKKKTELVFQPKIKMLIYGQAGVGKTTLALSAPKPLLIDCDNGVHRVAYEHIKDTVQVRSYDDVLAVLGEDLSDYETIVIDTGGKLIDFMTAYLIEKNPRLRRGGEGSLMMTQNGYGERKSLFVSFCKSVLAKGKHLVFVAHRQTQQEGDNYRYVPLFGGSNYDSLVTELDLVGYVEANGKKRVITFDPTDRNDGKNTCHLPGSMELDIVVDGNGNGLENTFLAKKVIDAYTERLSKMAKERNAVEELVNKVKAKLEEVDNADSLTEVYNWAVGLDHVGTSKAQVKKLIATKSGEIKASYDKEQKKFVSNEF